MATGQNRSQLGADDALLTTVEDLKREVRDLKQAQLIGADNILIDGISTSFTQTLTAGSIVYVTYLVTPNYTRQVNNINMWNPSIRIRVDNDSTNYRWPGGSSLTGGMPLVGVSVVINRGYSDDTIGKQGFTFSVQNLDSVTHTYYCSPYFYKFATQVTAA